MSSNAPSNDEEAMSSQTPQEESGTTALQNEADTVGIRQKFCLLNAYSSQQTQGPSEDDWREMIDDLGLLRADLTLRLARYKTILLVREATRPSTPVPSEISVDQLSTQQSLDLRRIVEHDIREATLLTDLREYHTRHRCRLAEVEKALTSAERVLDPDSWKLIHRHFQGHRRASRSLATRVHRLRRTIERS
ncbi:hypothetical protein D6D19_09605 [Aureobasidium pullulans]|uniref:Uncharacterized protein n=1 Tax=Aureobasidium pullulans TaxID=5580 RepID=A0A4S8ZCG4_AURPU|nr:hypothetical protein D6D19_09605 [Aureobasidium pullulans]THY15383.1 hypothetical protein D6D00_09373 [Aureobasidium pullulans]